MNFYPLRLRPLTLRPDYLRPGSLVIEASASDSVGVSDDSDELEEYGASDTVAVTDQATVVPAADLSVDDSILVGEYALAWTTGTLPTPDDGCWPSYSEVDIT